MSLFQRVVFGALVVGLVVPVGSAIAAEFTADLLIMQPDDSLKIKLYVRDDLYRVEQLQGENLFFAIENRTTDVTTAMNPEEKTYRELEGRAGAFANPVKGWEYMIKGCEERLVGPETVNGFECDHYVYNYPGDTKVVVERWHSKKLDHFMRYVVHYDGDLGSGTMEIRNVVEAPVDAALFRVSADYAREKTEEEKEMERPAITSQATAVAPVGRRMASGGELRVTVNPELTSRVELSNLAAGTSRGVIHPYRDGQRIDFSNYSPAPEEVFTLSYKGARTEQMYGMQHEADEIRIMLEEGRMMVIVYNEYSSFDDVTRRQYFVNPPGRGVSGLEGRPLEVSITGDSQAAGASHAKIHVYAQDFVDGYEQRETIEKIEFDLKNGEAKTLQYPAGEKPVVLNISLDEGGGLKVLTEQP